MKIKGSPEGFTDYRRNSWYYGGKLTRKNFDEVVELIKRCNNNFNKDLIVVDKVNGTIIFPVTDTDMTPKKETAMLGDWLARDVSGGWGEVRKYTAGEFKGRFTERVNFRQLRWYSLTEVEYQVLQALSDSDLCYGYDWIMDYTKVDRAETKKAVDHLRELKVVSFYRGLMNDDGEVAGSGFGTCDPLQEEMAELLCLRYEQRRIPAIKKFDRIELDGFSEKADGVYMVNEYQDGKLALQSVKEKDNA